METVLNILLWMSFCFTSFQLYTCELLRPVFSRKVNYCLKITVTSCVFLSHRTLMVVHFAVISVLDCRVPHVLLEPPVLPGVVQSQYFR